MIDIDRINNESEPSGSKIDYDANVNRRRDDRAEAWHKFWLVIITKLSYVALGVGVLFLVFLFLIVMPFSAIDTTAQTRIEWIRSYSYAFIYTLGNFGTTVLAVIVSGLIKHGYNLLTQKRKENE